MEDELNGVVPCSSLAVESTIRVGTAGALWGLCMGPYNSRKNGLSGVDHAAFVVSYTCYFVLISDYLDEMVALWRLSDLKVSLWSIFQAKSVGKNGFQCAKQIDCGCGRRSCNCYKD
ncbi:outer envelope pore protein 16-4, chloroplastic-like isoform X1 [Cucurbita pepo subsp. pepo]|uniref:outer envelope pore protein 16-4, chloroplastic-like isoform X1 n=1 Tax=Cucurbita pepo subsp. pepo TaxID=3664 RepID=UPI000C9D7E81|nr:outer envelope pore protein 16-4, chloroplastic-like isoform X1 [Cucurbita pepo subsp. pepo]